MTIPEIEKKYTEFKESVIRLNALREEKEELLQSKQKEYSKLEKTHADLAQAHSLLAQCNIVSRDFIKTEVEGLVTQGLRAIYEDPLIKFNIEFIEKRNQTEAIFYLTIEGDDARIESDIIFTYGGGIVDIISVSLRVIFMQLLKLEGPLILDEPGKNIAHMYISNFGKFLADVSTAFDRQIVIVTHNNALLNYANSIIDVEQKSGVSKVVNR